MVSRRQLLAGGIGAGAVAAPGRGDAAPQDDSAYLAAVVTELREIRRAVSIEGSEAVALVRAAQRTHLKNSGRFPEFVDVGYNVFNAVLDWLLALRQPADINRAAEGRYAVPFLMSTVVLRPDFPDDYVGQGYDK